MKREAATLQELRPAPSAFEIIICGIFSHTVGLQLLRGLQGCLLMISLPTLLLLRCCRHDLPDPYSLHFLHLFFFGFPGLDLFLD